jgi:predicted RNA-binding Zn ribbon-like protein
MAQHRPTPVFVADAPGLDFLNTVAAPWEDEIEWLGNGQDLLAWLVKAQLLPASVADAMRAGTVPGEIDAVAARARALREWFRAFVLAHAGRPVGSAALTELAPLNLLLERDEAYSSIMAPEACAEPDEAIHDHAPGLELRWHRRWRSPETLLLPIARAMADLVCETDFRLVKGCEGPKCTLLFLDSTRGPARRWCSMAMCGNRAKQAAHRARMRHADA